MVLFNDMLLVFVVSHVDAEFLLYERKLIGGRRRFIATSKF